MANIIHLHHLQMPYPNTAFAITLLLLLLLPKTFIFLTSLAKRRRFPPGPRGLPVIGNRRMESLLTHRGLAELAKVYGGLLHLRRRSIHVVAVSTAEMARQVLQVHDGVFANRPAGVAIRYLTYDRADMAFAHYGPFWRQMRKICVTKVFSRKRAKSWTSVRDEIKTMMNSIESRVSSPVNLGEMVLGLTKNITYRAAFGSTSQEGQMEFLKILQEFSKLFGALHTADFFPWLGRICGGRDFRNRLEKARGALDRFIDPIIDEHVEEKKKKLGSGADGAVDDYDLVDELMEFYDETGEKTTEDIPVSISRNNIKALIMDVMFGGTETVASAIEWAMAELLRSPDDLKKLQNELDDVVGLSRRVQDSDLDRLTFLRCVVKETLRLHPPIPLLLHETAADASICGYSIPGGSRVMINAWAIGRDGANWDEPEKFRPSRFLDSNAPDFRGSHFEFIPFGSGRRSCPGMQLGLYALELAVANLCHGFRWELPDGMSPEELDMSDVFGLTVPRAVRLVAVPTPRRS